MKSNKRVAKNCGPYLIRKGNKCVAPRSNKGGRVPTRSPYSLIPNSEESEDEIYGTGENIIPSNYDLSLSNFQELKLAEAYNKLIDKGKKENRNRQQEKYDKRIYNLSFKKISENFFSTWVTIIEDMTELINDDSNNKNFSNYINILIKDDRIIYVGIFLVLVSLFLFFIFMTK